MCNFRNIFKDHLTWMCYNKFFDGIFSEGPSGNKNLGLRRYILKGMLREKKLFKDYFLMSKL